MSGKGRVYRYGFYFTKKIKRFWSIWAEIICFVFWDMSSILCLWKVLMLMSIAVNDSLSERVNVYLTLVMVTTVYVGCVRVTEWKHSAGYCPSCITQLLLQLRISFLPLRTAQWKHINIHSARFIYCSQSVTPTDIDHDCAMWPVNYSKYQWMVYWCRILVCQWKTNFRTTTSAQHLLLCIIKVK